MNTVERPLVRWFGAPPSAEQRQVIEDRGLTLALDTPDAPDLRFARAVIYWGLDGHYRSVLDLLEAQLAQAVASGLLVYVVVPNVAACVKDAHQAVDQVLPGYVDRQLPVQLRAEPVSMNEIANAVLVHDPGPLANLQLSVVGAEQLESGDLYLLQRAFSDFSEIRLQAISPGFSGAKTFIVESRRLSPVNAEPAPFFLKVGEATALAQELKHFRKYAEHFITWTLRPNFVPEQSVNGGTRGLLVGTFLEGAESLGACARRGEGVPYIKSLFEVTMAGLRKNLTRVEASSVVSALHEYDRSDCIPPERVEAARRFGGTVEKPRNLWRELLSAPKHDYWQCVMHGDTHGENVRVRRGEAFLIDYAHTGEGPACADPAMLEVWLAFEPDGVLDRDRWLAAVEHLYRPEVIDRALAGEHRPEDSWLDGCLAEIRRIAAGSVHSPDEYKRVLAVFLLQHASYRAARGNEEEDEFRRCYAYWVANRLVLSLAATDTASAEKEVHEATS